MGWGINKERLSKEIYIYNTSVVEENVLERLCSTMRRGIQFMRPS